MFLARAIADPHLVTIAPPFDCCLLLVPLLSLILSPSLLPPWVFLHRAIADPHLVTIAPSFDCFLLLVPLLTLILSPSLLLAWIVLAICALVDPSVTAIAAATLDVSC